MKLSIQIIRGFTALAFCAATGAYAVTHSTPDGATPTVAAMSVEVAHVTAAKVNGEDATYEVSVVVGEPVSLGVPVAPAAESNVVTTVTPVRVAGHG